MTDQTRPMDAEELELIRERHETSLDASPSSCDYCVDENGNPVPLGTCDAVHLLAEVTRLTAERDAALARKDEWHERFKIIAAERDALLKPDAPCPACDLGDDDADCTCWDWLHTMAQARAAIESRDAELARLRAVIEEARALHDAPAAVNPGLCETCLDARPCDTFEMLDRGLKGAGDV